MLAWKKFGNGETPATSGLKGDKLVGNYYVKFDQEYKKEIAQLVLEGKTEEEAKKQAPLILEAQQMLLQWEAGDPQVVALWKTMNSWVYDGFDVTYKNLGVDFDTLYFESDTYLLGKDSIDEGLKSEVFYQKEDGSVWCDLTDEGLDEKIVITFRWHSSLHDTRYWYCYTTCTKDLPKMLVVWFILLVMSKIIIFRCYF